MGDVRAGLWLRLQDRRTLNTRGWLQLSHGDEGQWGASHCHGTFLSEAIIELDERRSLVRIKARLVLEVPPEGLMHASILYGA